MVRINNNPLNQKAPKGAKDHTMSTPQTKSEYYSETALRFAQLVDFTVYHSSVTGFIRGEFTGFQEGVVFRMLCDRLRAENLKALEVK
tara:strand:+ start:313 stop:576 length:264 start_codon:yes stop_codon:yes gene_type:complete